MKKMFTIGRRLGWALIAAWVAGSLAAGSALAASVNFNYVSIATATDEGPQDGLFDAFVPVNLGSVNNNGFTSFRTAFEFDLSGLPSGSVINSAQLIMDLSNFEGTRTIEVHGYAGNGTVQLGDFSLDGLVGAANIATTGTQSFTFDVTGFVAELTADGKTFAGFSIREEPANAGNFLVMFLQGVAAGVLPKLSIEFSTERIVDLDIKPGGVPNSINPRSEGRIAVAVLSSAAFNATSEVDIHSLTFGRTGNESSLISCGAPEDVNSDGLLDLVCHFDTAAAAFLSGDTQGVLKGLTVGGATIKGADSVRVLN